MKDLNKIALHKPTFFYTHWRRMLLHIYTMNQLRTRRYRWLNPYIIEKSRPKMKDLNKVAHQGSYLRWPDKSQDYNVHFRRYCDTIDGVNILRTARSTHAPKWSNPNK